jgi:hypothetical protein
MIAEVAIAAVPMAAVVIQGFQKEEEGCGIFCEMLFHK